MENENEKLEELMKINPENMTSEDQIMFLNELKNAQLFLPVEITSDSFDLNEMEIGKTLETKEPLRFKPMKLHDSENNIIIPVFTSIEIFQKSNIISSTIVINSEDLANMLKDLKDEFDDIMINPNTENSIGLNLDSFLQLFNSNENDTLSVIIDLFEEYATALEENCMFFLREEEPFMKNYSVDGIFTSEIPFNVSSQNDFHKDYPYLNILLLDAGTKILYIGDIIDTDTNYDTILEAGIKFKFKGNEDEYTMVWECINE